VLLLSQSQLVCVCVCVCVCVEAESSAKPLINWDRLLYLVLVFDLSLYVRQYCSTRHRPY
jgi:hypothetical protein